MRLSRLSGIDRGVRFPETYQRQRLPFHRDAVQAPIKKLHIHAARRAPQPLTRLTALRPIGNINPSNTGSKTREESFPPRSSALCKLIRALGKRADFSSRHVVCASLASRKKKRRGKKEMGKEKRKRQKKRSRDSKVNSPGVEEAVCEGEMVSERVRSLLDSDSRSSLEAAPSCAFLTRPSPSSLTPVVALASYRSRKNLGN